MAAGKENKKQLDMLTSVIVNYNSIERVRGSLELIRSQLSMPANKP